MSIKRILIFGLPGSGKTTLANKLAKKIGAINLNADEVREQFQDWDFSNEGRLRQAKRWRNSRMKQARRTLLWTSFAPPKNIETS